MKIVTIKGIDNIKSYLIQVNRRADLQPELIMTDRHDSYIEYGADKVIDIMKSHIMYDCYNEHHVRFGVDGLSEIVVQIDFIGNFDDEQYKVIKALVFMWYRVLFNTLSKKMKKGKLLMKEMDIEYYENNMELMSNIVVQE